MSTRKGLGRYTLNTIAAVVLRDVQMVSSWLVQLHAAAWQHSCTLATICRFPVPCSHLMQLYATA